MALSGTFKSSEDNGANISLDPSNPRWCSYIYVKWSATQDIDQNKSTITWQCYGGSNYSNTTSYVSCGPVTVKINGTTVLRRTDRFSLHKDDLIGSGSLTVTHNGDGTKSISASISAAIYNFAENCKYSGTITLNTIPRATVVNSVTCATSYFDGAITYKYIPQSASFYNRCMVYLNAGGTLTSLRTIEIGKKTAAQQSASITLTAAELSKIYKAMPKTTSGKIRVSIGTYSDSAYKTKVGDTAYKEVSLTIPTAVKPTASLTESPVNTNAWIKGLGVYVQGYSGISASLTGVAGEGASVSSYEISGGGYSSNKNALSVSKITASGSIKFTGTVTDSRGRSASSSKTISVLPYSMPAITSLTVERGKYSTGSWTAGENGTDVKVTFNTTLSLTANGNVYSTAFSIAGTATMPGEGSTTNLSSGSDEAVYFLNVDAETSKTLTLTVTDKVGNKSAASVTIPTIHVTMEFRKTGNGIAFGKTSERDAFECAWPAHFGDAVYVKDKIVGTDEYYAKDFNVSCKWIDGAEHDLITRLSDGLTVAIGWTGSGSDGKSYNTVLDMQSKNVNVRGTLTLSKTTDASGTADNGPALIVGGTRTTAHMEMDSNEIQAKSDGTTPAILNLNHDGGLVAVGSGGLKISGFAGDRVVVTDADGKLRATTGVTVSDLACLDGVTSNIQTQLNSKLSGSSAFAKLIYGGTISLNGTKTVNCGFTPQFCTLFMSSANSAAPWVGCAVNFGKNGQEFRVYTTGSAYQRFTLSRSGNSVTIKKTGSDTVTLYLYAHR